MYKLTDNNKSTLSYRNTRR